MKVLLVIDMVEDFFREGPLFDARKTLTDAINRLVKETRDRSIPVIWVRQAFQEDLSDAFPIMRKENIRITIAGTQGCRILSELDPKEAEREVIKKRYSAFFQTELDSHLKQLGATELLLAGVNTHACVRTTAIDAYQLDYEVTIPIECVASYDRQHHEVTLNYFEGRIARLVSIEDLWNATRS